MSFATISLRACAALGLPSLALAQTPFLPLSDLWITDSNNDRIVRVRDLDFDGDYDGAGEVAVYYDDTLGAFSLSNNNALWSSSDGTLFVADTSADFMLALRDIDADGDANDANEAIAYFTSAGNASGVEAQSLNGICMSGAVVYAAVAQAGSTGKDFVLRCQDLNADGDADDANEAREYFVRSDMSVAGSNSNDSLAQDVEVGNDGNVYYLEVGTSGLHAKGIYKLVDGDSSGAIDAGEVSAFFVPPAQAASAFHWSIEQDAAGVWWLQDTGNDLVWRAFDANANGVIDGGEATAWWTSPGASIVWDCHRGADGRLYVSESQNNERVFVMADANANGVIDTGSEVSTAYDELVALGAPVGQIRGFALDARWQAPATSYCTAQTNSQGCTPAISSIGWPSATFGSGHLLGASNVLNQKVGILFYGVNGSQATPFQGGTMCVAAPRVRTPLQSSGGSTSGTDCTGSFNYDFNSRIASGLDSTLVQGAVVNAQYWSRDPASPPANTNLTDAVEFTILR